jgi:hypothetical protein
VTLDINRRLINGRGKQTGINT